MVDESGRRRERDAIATFWQTFGAGVLLRRLRLLSKLLWRGPWVGGADEGRLESLGIASLHGVGSALAGGGILLFIQELDSGVGEGLGGEGRGSPVAMRALSVAAAALRSEESGGVKRRGDARRGTSEEVVGRTCGCQCVCMYIHIE